VFSLRTNFCVGSTLIYDALKLFVMSGHLTFTIIDTAQTKYNLNN